MVVEMPIARYNSKDLIGASEGENENLKAIPTPVVVLSDDGLLRPTALLNKSAIVSMATLRVYFHPTILLEKTQKTPTLYVRMLVGKKSQSIDSKIRSRIYGHGKGWVFTPKHFVDLGGTAAIDSCFRRLKAAGRVRQLARGLYDYPVHDSILGVVAPSADAIARALVARDAIRIQPSGAYAANVLGLSDQVPSRIVFLTDGPARKVTIGKRDIILQHTTPRNMATAGRISGTLIQALRYLGRNHVDDLVIATLRRHITESDRPAIRKDLVHAPAWIADLLRRLIEPLR
jgi:hypothetical protein